MMSASTDKAKCPQIQNLFRECSEIIEQVLSL